MKANIKTQILDYIRSLTAEDVLNIEILRILKERSADDIYTLEPGRAKEFYDALEEVFLKYEASIKQQSEVYKTFGSILLSMLWKSMMTLKAEVRNSLLSNNVVFCLKNGVDIKGLLKRHMDLYESGFVADVEERSVLIRSLESNPEKIGTQFLSFKTSGQVPPTISNWIKDYNANFPLNPKKPDAKRGKLEQLNYLKSSPNVKTLIAEDKKTLEDILSIYDWLRFPVIEYREWKETAQSKPTPLPATKLNMGFELPTAKLNISKPAVPSPVPKVVLPPKPAPIKPVVPQPPAKPQTPKPNLGLKDLGPYVLGGNPETSAPQAKKPVAQQPSVPKQSTPVETPQEPTTTIPSNKYAGFSSNLIKDVEEFSDSVKTKTTYTAPPPPQPLSVPEPKPVTEPAPAPKPAEPVKPKLSPAGQHELEDLLERSRLKADANIPLSETDTKAIIDLIKRKKENK